MIGFFVGEVDDFTAYQFSNYKLAKSSCGDLA